MKITTRVEGIYIPESSPMKDFPDTCSMRISNYVTVEASNMEKVFEVAKPRLENMTPYHTGGEYYLAMMRCGGFECHVDH